MSLERLDDRACWQQLGARPRTPMIFTSGCAGGTLERQCRRAEAHLFGPSVCFLQKPFGRRDLLHAVSGALELGREAR
jgi:hypothetical protein